MKNHNQNSQKQKKNSELSQAYIHSTWPMHRNFREKSVTPLSFLISWNTSPQNSLKACGRRTCTWHKAKRFPKNNSDTTKIGVTDADRIFWFSRPRQEGRPWGASTGGLVHTAARIKRTEGRGRSSLSARYKAMRTSRSNQYRLWH